MGKILVALATMLVASAQVLSPILASSRKSVFAEYDMIQRASSSTLYDISGNGHNGTLSVKATASPPTGALPIWTPRGLALSDEQYVALPYHTTALPLTVLAAVTVSNGAGNIIYSNGTSGNWALNLTTDMAAGLVTTTPSTSGKTSGTVAPAYTCQVVGSNATSSVLALYIAGASAASTNLTNITLRSSTGNDTIGAYGDKSLIMMGTIEYMMVFNRAITAAEISAYTSYIRSRIALRGLTTTTPIPIGAGGSGSYVMSTFGYHEQRLHIWVSPDAKTWDQVTSGPVYTPTGGNIVRDPSIMYYGGKWWVAYTTGYGVHNYFGIASSSDLVTWTLVGNIDPGLGASLVFAPEWFVDGANVYVFFNYGSGTGTAHLYYVQATDTTGLTTWGAANAVLASVLAYDPFPIKIGSTYYLFYKNFTSGYLEYATASSVGGTYTPVGTGDWAGWGTGIEGIALVQTVAGSPGTWRMYADRYVQNQIQYSDSSDGFATWTTLAPIIGPFAASHPTVVKVP